MIILSVICTSLLIIIVRLLLAIREYQAVLTAAEYKLRKYDTWLRATSTWLEEEMAKREIPGNNMLDITGKKFDVSKIKCSIN